ncbi:NADH:flavin oxidoreductase/NADH oxidase [Trueperella sp. LYQ143]|uniref:oxidoreductase n=1 Tax=unclassified Trueperella TaxID=2630174 RepID=UPI003982D7CD
MDLFDPIELRGLTVRNRLWLPPMCQYSAQSSGLQRGLPNEWHVQHYASRAVGGFGVVTVEATAVCPEGRISPNCLLLDRPEALPAFTRLAQAIRAHGAVPAIQLQHAGRKASTPPPWQGGGYVPHSAGGWSVVGPSDVPFDETLPTPRVLDDAEILEIIGQFAAAARLAQQAGFEAVEIHAAHGYLIHQFLSPISNHRTDRWGGDAAGRSLILREIVSAVRAAVGDMPIIVRLSATDWLAELFENREGGYGWRVTDSIELVGSMPEVDFWSISTGGNVPVKIPTGPGYQVPFARRIREETGALVGVAGLIANAQQARVIVLDEEADVVYVGRVALHDPYIARHWAREIDTPMQWPNQYVRGVPER